MSINSAMLAGVSGLVANSSALAAISDNIANVNTVAYKRNQVNFANVVTAQAVKGKYSAGGVQGITRQFVSQQGLIQSSGSSTDLAISGDGFFIVTDKGAGLTAADTRKFTRQGSFSVDADGYLVNDSRLYLQGWPVQADGSFNVVTTLNSLDHVDEAAGDRLRQFEAGGFGLDDEHRVVERVVEPPPAAGRLLEPAQLPLRFEVVLHGRVRTRLAGRGLRSGRDIRRLVRGL